MRNEQETTAAEFLVRHRWRLLFLGALIAAAFSRVIADMVIQWKTDDNYSHGFLVPFLSAYFLYERRALAGQAPVRPAIGGLVVVAGSLALLLVGNMAFEYFTMRLSLVFLLCGLTLFLFGWPTFRLVLLPLLYLLLMIPLPSILYDTASFPLKIFVTKSSVEALKLFGIPVLREGNILYFSEFSLEVADACSGLRSILSLLALGIAVAFLFGENTRNRVILVVSTIPIAVVTNAFRVIVTGLLSQRFGTAVATGFFHEFAGLSVFAMAILLLGAEFKLLKWLSR